MPRKAHKYHYIYKTTCNVTEKFYIGMHSCSNLEDGYMGSGKRLRLSLNKYGIENYTKVILEFLPDRKSLAEREKELVDQEMLNEDLCMNIQLGGGGGFNSIENQKARAMAGGKALSNKLKSDPEFMNIHKERSRLLMKKRHTDGLVKYDTMTGKTHSRETIQKMKDSKKGHGIGSNNSQFGTCWITNEIESKKIYKGDIIPEGWKLGRKSN